MNCADFELELEHSIASRQPIGPAAEHHAAECRRCARLQDEHGQLDQLINVWSLTQPPIRPRADFVDTVVRKLAAEVPIPSVTMHRESTAAVPPSAGERGQSTVTRHTVAWVQRPIAWCSAALATMLVISLQLIISSKSDRIPDSHTNAAPAASAQPGQTAKWTMEPSDAASLDEQVRTRKVEIGEILVDAQKAYFNLAQTAAGNVSAATGAVTNGESLSGLLSRSSAAVRSESTLTSQLQHDLEPIGTQVDRAFGWLIQLGDDHPDSML